MARETGEDSLIGLVQDALDLSSPSSSYQATKLRRERRDKFIGLADEVLEKYPHPLPTEISCPFLASLSKPVIVQVDGKEIPVHVARYVHEYSGEPGVERDTVLAFINKELRCLIHVFGVAQYTPLNKGRFFPRETRIHKSCRVLASNFDVENGLNALIFISEELPFSDS